ncbi:MAG TPA: NAD-dependent epimerase/dehydratase family protein [Nitrososphaera sp.]|nr:NAD-dependent epimerase/dehydratase family protein [Nitrososphaera sp.]
MSILVTGGAGFIGSNLVKALITDGRETQVLDNLSSGRMESLERVRRNAKFSFQKQDLLNKESLAIPQGCKSIFHLAANPEVRVGFSSPELHFTQNVVTTFNLLEAARKGDAETIAFASTSTVYGDARTVPTPEDYAPMEPISMYGASKLACESIITSYAHNYGIRAIIFRLANIIGPDSNHGVIYDFTNKLVKDPSRLEVLGDGTQNKSYLHISDCVSAILAAHERAREKVNVYNVGSQDQVRVTQIAKAVIDAMKSPNTRIELTGGVDNGRGWKGDVKNMLLDVTRISDLGWRPRYSSLEAVKLTANELAIGVAGRS